eukprot:COSAG01_NODE_2930_length_6835_cov_82.625891_9_plen_39_part_00
MDAQEAAKQQSQPGTITALHAWYQQACADGAPPRRSSS